MKKVLLFKKKALSLKQLGLQTAACKKTGMAIMASALLASSVSDLKAQTLQSYDFGARLTQGYSITPMRTGVDDGVAMAGTDMIGKTGTSVHFMTTDPMGVLGTSIEMAFNVKDVRAIAIQNITPNTFVLVTELHEPGKLNRIGIVMLDATGKILKTMELGISDKAKMQNPHALNAIVWNKRVFICGYATEKPEYPNDPSYQDSRSSFIARVDLVTQATEVSLFNTPIYTGSIPIPYPGGYNDYDMATRLKVVNGKLYLLGSVNGISQSVTDNATLVYNVAASKAWIATINPSTLQIATQTVYGKYQAAGYTTPITLDGLHALDIIEDKEYPGEYYALSNSLRGEIWGLTHMDAAMQVSMPVAGWGSTSYAGGPYKVKAAGVFNSPDGSSNVSVYGVTGDELPLANMSAYGTTIESPINGAVPYVINMNVNYDPIYGVSISSEKGYLHGNAMGYATGLNFQQPFFTQAAMGEWCNIPFGIQVKDANHLQLMGHVKMNPGTMQPRYIRSAADGYLNGCNAAEPMDLSPMGGLGLGNMEVVAEGGPVGGFVIESSVKVQKRTLLNQYDCSSTNIYRTAKPGTALEETSVVKGLYPNPATDKVTVMLGSDVAAGDAVKVVITDVAGRVVLAQSVAATGNSLQLALPRLTAGLYQAAVSVGQNPASVYKLVIQ